MSGYDGHTLHTTRSLTSSDGESYSTSPLKTLELNIDKLSHEQVRDVSKSPPLSNCITTTQQTDILCLDTTSPIRLSRTPFTPLYSPPKRITKLARLESNEVLPEVELMISKFFKEFINTDALPVLRGILTFKSFRYKAETQNRMISPYIEKSLSVPLRYKDMEYTLKITPLSKRYPNRGCSYNPARRAIGMSRSNSDNSFQSNSKLVSDTSYENCPIKLLETSQTKIAADTPSKMHLTNISRSDTVKSPSMIRLNNSLESSNISVSNNTYENYPINLLETSQMREDTSIRDTPAKTQLTSNKIHVNNSIGIANDPLLNSSYDTCPIKLLGTSQMREDTSITDTPIRTHLTNLSQTNIVRTPNNIPIKLLDTSTERDVLHHNTNGNTPLALASPTCSIRLLDTSTPDILASSSRSICQALDFKPSACPLSNSTPSKRTFSKMKEVNLSKRVRLDYDVLKSTNNTNYLD